MTQVGEKMAFLYKNYKTTKAEEKMREISEDHLNSFESHCIIAQYLKDGSKSNEQKMKIVQQNFFLLFAK